MSRKIVWVFAGVLVALGASACEMTKSEHPLGPTVAGPIPGRSEITALRPTPPISLMAFCVSKRGKVSINRAQNEGSRSSSTTTCRNGRAPANCRARSSIFCRSFG